MNILSMLGLTKEPKVTLVQTPLSASNDRELLAMTASRNDWKRMAEAAERKFNTAINDLAAMKQDAARTEHMLSVSEEAREALGDEVAALRPDAQLWRNARDKRSQGRGASNDAAPKAKKGVRS